MFAYHIHDPERYDVVGFDENFCILSPEEKPSKPRSNYAVAGLYFYDTQVCDITVDIKPSVRGELETMDVNRRYLEQDSLGVEIMGHDYARLNTRVHDSLLEAAAPITTLQKRQGLMAACPEGIVYRKN